MTKKSDAKAKGTRRVDLPSPARDGSRSVESALAARRSVRGFREDALPLAAVGQLLWAAQGVTEEGGLRTAPSAGATYPMVLYLLAGGVDGLAPGLYRYVPAVHKLSSVAERDERRALASVALAQRWIAEAPVSILVVADYDRTTNRYGERGVRYVRMEAGHIAQNVHLQAVALGYGSAPVAAFEDRAIQDLLELPENEEPLYIIPVGVPKE